MKATKILDILTKKNVTEYYELYKETQWYDADTMKLYQLGKLKRLVKHCYDNVPFYRKYMNNLRLTPEDIKSLEQIKLFPIITKEIIQQNYTSFIPDNIKEIKGVKTSQTGGTTGNPLFKRNDANTRSSVWGTYKRYEDWLGHLNTDKTLIMMGGSIKNIGLKGRIISKGVSLLENSMSVDIYNTSDETIDKIIILLSKNKFSYIRSYPQFLFSVAQKLEQKSLSFKLKSISLTAEPVMPKHRELFKKIFNSEVFDQYGCGEIGGIAYECDRHEGLHIAEERVIIEINKLNELIITDLDNYSMPFIRYWNADQAEISEKYCSCGRKSKLIKKIIGRTCDNVVGVNGQILHPSFFWLLIYDSNVANNKNLRKFQIVQNSKTNLLIRLVADPLSDEEKELIISDIKKRMGDMTIEFSYEPEIENTETGKYRAVINKII